MAVGLNAPAKLLPIAGIRLGTGNTGTRYSDRPDLLLIECVTGTTITAVFTQNRFCAAPVVVAKRHLQVGSPRALLVNAGSANAGNGQQGIDDAMECCRSLATHLDCQPEEILPFSTGVIGERLAVPKLLSTLPDCINSLNAGGWLAAANSIMTTDTIPKGCSRQITVEGKTITISGIVKGAGMIHPNMATLLVFIATDAAIVQATLDKILHECVDQSFNRITVDGDTSTNDACVLMATGQAKGINFSDPASQAYGQLLLALTSIFQELAQAIVRDAEGATKFVTIEVSGGESEADCAEVANTIASSPLVKTALFASDPNWGRILAAIGRARIDRLDIDQVDISINDVNILHRGCVDEDYSEEKGQAAMKPDELHIQVSLGNGDAHACVWTSDLSHEYIQINSEYRS